MSASWVVFVCGVGYLTLQGGKALGAAVALWQARHHRDPALPAGWMANVALVQPILGGDPLLEAVLSHNLQAMPQAHFVWLLDEADTVGRATAAQLVRAHPQHHIRCSLHGAAGEGVNPKTFKLAATLPSVKETYLVVLDDDVRLSADSLARLVGALDKADLATALPCYRDDGLPGARLMAQFVNNNAALTYLSLLPLQSPLTINGMCYALRTDRLRELGGFAPLQHQLADDLAMAQALRAAGARLHQCTAAVEVQTHTPSLVRYVQQMHRWFLFATLLLRSESRGMQWLIALLHGLPPLLLAGLLCAALWQPTTTAWVWVVLVLSARAALLCGLQWASTGRVRHRPLASLLSEWLQPLHLLHALVVRRIRWRTRVYRVRNNDDFHAD